MFVFLALSILYPTDRLSGFAMATKTCTNDRLSGFAMATKTCTNDRLSGFAMATKTCGAAKLYQRPLNLMRSLSVLKYTSESEYFGR